MLLKARLIRLRASSLISIVGWSLPDEVVEKAVEHCLVADFFAERIFQIQISLTEEI